MLSLGKKNFYLQIYFSIIILNINIDLNKYVKCLFIYLSIYSKYEHVNNIVIHDIHNNNNNNNNNNNSFSSCSSKIL